MHIEPLYSGRSLSPRHVHAVIKFDFSQVTMLFVSLIYAAAWSI